LAKDGVSKIRIVSLENDLLKMCIAPDFGAKVLHLIDKRSDYQWLWTDSSRPIRPALEGDLYPDHDVTGIDECFPNIGISKYPGSTNLVMPDHGELWSRKWEYELEENRLKTVVQGSIFPYTFSREILIEESKAKFSYEINNFGNESFLAFWTLHALFRAEQGMKIVISGNPLMTKEFGFSSRMGFDGDNGYEGHLERYTWPKTLGATGGQHDLSEIDLQTPLTDKVVLQTPINGEVRLVNTKVGRSLKFALNPNELPYFGICFNLGAWPFTGEKATWVALEPSHGATDRLDEAFELGSAIEFLPYKPIRFSFTLTLE
jgi:galactose mutarotase-like enzyme